jgi:predicted GH43/DUF377 family glycosyl hydrolase
MTPEPSEREGYVPNVVYSCGALLHESQLIIPYGLADHATGFATWRYAMCRRQCPRSLDL